MDSCQLPLIEEVRLSVAVVIAAVGIVDQVAARKIVLAELSISQTDLLISTLR